MNYKCNSLCFGKTKKKLSTLTKEYQQDSFKGKWNNSEAKEHTLTCHVQFNWIHQKTMDDHRKRKIQELPVIEMAKFNKKMKVLNRVEGIPVKTTTWTFLFVNVIEM